MPRSIFYGLLLVFVIAYVGNIAGTFQTVMQASYGKTTDVHDIAVSDITVFKTVVGQGYTMEINVTVENLGTQSETFNVSAFANATSFSTLTDVNLPNGNSAVLLCIWNTTGYVHGNYTISAYAEPLPDETNTTNNNFTCAVPVHVGVPGDVSSEVVGVYNRQCDMKDIAYLIVHFMGKPGSSKWDPNADINDDNVINMKDVAIAVLNFNHRENFP